MLKKKLELKMAEKEFGLDLQIARKRAFSEEKKSIDPWPNRISKPCGTKIFSGRPQTASGDIWKHSWLIGGCLHIEPPTRVT